MKKKLSLFVLLLIPLSAFAHVKWFSDYSFQNPPLKIAELAKLPAFIGLFILSVVSMPIMVWLDKLADKSQLYHRTNAFLDRYAENAPVIMRIAMGAVLLMSWQNDAMVAPEIGLPGPIWGWFQFVLGLCLLFKETTIFAGVGILILYFLGVSQQGMFHMLDYIVYPAVGLYFIVTSLKSEKWKNFDLPILYSGLGFSLCWVSFEKLIYPYWGLSVLSKAPALTMGLPHDFFLMSAAFVEFSLGYLLIICLLHRPLAIIITLVFFITTAFFGKTEVVGHTILHGALLVFIVKGPGHYYQAPIRFHSNWKLRYLFASVNFIILFVLLAIPYQKMADAAFAKSMDDQAKMAHPKLEIPAGTPAPTIMIHPYKDAKSGWNLHIMTSNFKFSPEKASTEDVIGEGHAHLFVNGKKVGRVYSDWIHVTIGKGQNKVKVNLTSNSHKDYFFNGNPVEAEIELNEEREVSIHHAH